MRTNIFHKTLNFGKVDYYGNGRKSNAVEIELTLKENTPGEIEFTAMGSIWNCRHTDIVVGGQCIDEIAKLFPLNKKVQRIHEIWKRWHLNSMHAGCVHQRAFETEPYDKHAGAHCDICNYTYGTAWKFETIPGDILEEIKNF